MKISIQPVTLLVPGKGTVVADILAIADNVSYKLHQGATGFYDLQKRTITPAVEEVRDEAGNLTTPAVPERIVDESIGMSGHCELTPEQFAAWGKDDDWFARCIAQNLGLFPLTPA